MKSPFLVACNWKMNPGSMKEALALANASKKVKRSLVNLLLIPPYPYIAEIKKLVRTSLLLGAQTVAPDDTHAHTGEVSAKMLASLGAKYVIVGHSEVRARDVGNEDVGAMAREVLKWKMMPILCVGEMERDHNGFFLHEVKTQIEDALAMIPKAQAGSLVVAYEPVWAIGESAVREATPEEFREMAIFIRKVFSDSLGAKAGSDLVIIYGGSVDEKNAGDFLEGGAQGFLIGRASLDPRKLEKIVATTEAFAKRK